VLNAILQLHREKPLLTEQDLVDESEDGEPENGCDINAESGRNGSFHYSQKRLGWPCNENPRHLIQIRVRVPRCDNSAKLKCGRAKHFLTKKVRTVQCSAKKKTKIQKNDVRERS